MFGSYRSILAIPGARAFVIGSSIARLGSAMIGVSVVAMVAGRHGSYDLAGLVSAAGLVALATTTSAVGRLIDTYGQLRVTGPLLIWSTVFCGLTALASWQRWPDWTLFALFALSAVVATTDAMSRARWAHLLAGDEPRLHTAMSLEQVLDEISFVIGPVLGVMLATTFFPEAGYLAAATFFAVGSAIFLAGRRTEPPAAGREAQPTALAVRNPALLLVSIIMVLTGCVFGSNEVVTLAFCAEHGQRGLAGWVLALFAAGSGTSAILIGTRTIPGSLSRALLIGVGAMCLLEAPVLLVDTIPSLALVLFVAGFATAPTLITSIKLAQAVVPATQINEALSLVLTGLIVGLAAGSAVGGAAVQAGGAHRGYLVPIGAAFIAFLIAALAFGRLQSGGASAARA